MNYKHGEIFDNEFNLNKLRNHSKLYSLTNTIWQKILLALTVRHFFHTPVHRLFKSLKKCICCTFHSSLAFIYIQLSRSDRLASLYHVWYGKLYCYVGIFQISERSECSPSRCQRWTRGNRERAFEKGCYSWRRYKKRQHIFTHCFSW